MLTGRSRRARQPHVLVAAALALSACGSGTPSRSLPDPQGPPSVQAGVVAEHADQFDDALADRPAGSQREFAASTYILGHLQTAGYVPLLDPVPVKDLVRSTNVVAAPPSGVEPKAVVAVAYDTGEDAQPTGAALGLWLELARALYARDQHHAVEFVALGAENTDLNDGNLGSRRLVELLRGDGVSPLVVLLGQVSGSDGAFSAVGESADELTAVADRLAVSAAPPPARGGTEAVLVRAGLRHVTVGGDVGGVGRVLLEFLASSDDPDPSGS